MVRFNFLALLLLVNPKALSFHQVSSFFNSFGIYNQFGNVFQSFYAFHSTREFFIDFYKFKGWLWTAFFNELNITLPLILSPTLIDTNYKIVELSSLKMTLQSLLRFMCNWFVNFKPPCFNFFLFLIPKLSF